MKKYLALSALTSAMCLQASAGYLTNFGEPNTDKLVQALSNKHVHIVQLGDSHTAGDSMTDALRTSLQVQYGNGGMGWAMPMYFSGQRMARFGYDNYQWTPISSRTNKSEDYTLGGLIAKPNGAGSSLTIKSKRQEPTQNIIVSIKQGANDGAFSGIDADGNRFSLQAPRKNGTWQTTQITAKLPLTITTEGMMSDSAIGGWWAFNANQTGATVSALGINGAELSHWNRWNANAWQNELATIAPNLIILAYGTNEAYNNVSAEQVRQVLTERIHQIRKASPNSAIMVVSSPEALKSTAGKCGNRPQYLSQIQSIQKQTAQTERTLYWDWQEAMGGSCSMNSWIGSGKASRDGVHFTHTGYTELGNMMADDILALTSGTAQPTSDNYPTTYQPTHTHPTIQGGLTNQSSSQIIR